MNQSPTAPAPGVRQFHQHGAFADLDAALYRIRLAADALMGIGNLLHPEKADADEQLNMAMRHDASAIFAFFGEVLGECGEIAAEARETLQQEAEHLPPAASVVGGSAKGGVA